MKITKTKFFATALFAAVLPFGLQAQTITWGGTDGEYTTPGNWVGGVLPDTNGGETALITGGNVTYTPGGDLPIHNGGTLQISGGSWTQAGGPAWIQMSGGNLVVDGGVFNQGSSGDIVRDASSSISISAGTANLNGDWNYNPSSTGEFNVTGGTVNIGGLFSTSEAFNLGGNMSTVGNFITNAASSMSSGYLTVGNELQPVDGFTVSGGTLDVGNLIAFVHGPGKVDLGGGSIILDGSGPHSGFYAPSSTAYLNFTSGSNGMLRFENYTSAELTTDGFLSNGTIRYNDISDEASFIISESGGGVNIMAIPEPSSIFMALMGMGLIVVTVRRRK